MCWVENRALNPMHQNTVSLFLEGRKRGWDIPQSENKEKRHLQVHQKFKKPGCHYTNVILQKLCLLSQMETETLSNSFSGPRLSSENRKLNSSVTWAPVSLLCPVWTSALPECRPGVSFISSGLLRRLTSD